MALLSNTGQRNAILYASKCSLIKIITSKLFALNARFILIVNKLSAMERKLSGMWILVILVIVSAVLAGCTGTPGKENTPTVTSTILPVKEIPVVINSTGPVSENERSVAEANNRFAFDLFSHLSKDPANAGSNIFFSPFSISSALALTYEGARGPTADEIRSVFHFPAADTVRKRGYSDINAGINKIDTGYTLRTANSLWADKDFLFLPEYVGTASQHYNANTTNLDFINKPEESRATINRWVEQKTENKIHDLIPSGAINSATRLVITNAIYFKGTWIKQFDKNNTQPMDFQVSPNKTVPVQMMQRTDEDGVYNYAETDGVQMLEMPYAHGNGKDLSMVVILPEKNNLTAEGAVLDPQLLSHLQNSSTPRRVMVYFPKFKIETEYRLPATLSSMGMPLAFTVFADFSGMDGAKDLFISDVIHKAYIDLNEEGTEAAAATGVIFWKTAVRDDSPIPVFKADHPFVILIRDNDTGTILFIGEVTNPNGP
jgi:serpin B